MDQFEKDMLFLNELVLLAIREKMPVGKMISMLTEAMQEILEQHKHNMSPELRAEVEALKKQRLQ